MNRFRANEAGRLLIKRYYEERPLVAHQIEAFNDFVERGIQQVVDEVKEIEIELLPPGVKSAKIKLGKAWLAERPTIREIEGITRPLHPNEARMRNLTYEAPLMLEMSMEVNGEEIERSSVQIGYIPIMVKSKYCRLYGLSSEEQVELGEDPDDPGGYFIINGTEKVVVCVEDLAPNVALVEYKEDATYPWIARIFSERGQYTIPHAIEKGKDGIIYITFARVMKVPIALVMKACGLVRDRDVTEAISLDPRFEADIYVNLYKVMEIEDASDALQEIGRRMGIVQSREQQIVKAEQMIDQYLLPHLGERKEDRMKKAYYLGRVVKKLLCLAHGLIKEDDKDHYKNKRVRLCSDLLESLFRFAFRQLVGDMKFNFERFVRRKSKIPPLASTVRARLLTLRLRSALATGEWVRERRGVSQSLDRTNKLSVISHLTRVVSLLTAARENFEARDLHPTHWGRVCMVETPEGPQVGLRKNLALLAEITTEPSLSQEEFKELLKKHGMGPIAPDKIDVYLNNEVVGTVEDGDAFAKALREARRRGELPYELNVGYRKGEGCVWVNTERGRIRRPLIVVEGGRSKLTNEIVEQLKRGEIKFFDLVKRGIIEYLDAEEEENCLVALKEEELTQQHTHLEIHPLCVFGICASLVPFPEYNLSYRSIIGAKLLKQGLGIYVSNYLKRIDSDVNLLHYPQKPIVKTFGYENVVPEKNALIGNNVVVAIMSYGGFNIEDAIIVNRGSIERGLFRSTFFRPYETEELRYPGGQKDSIQIPEKDVEGYRIEECYRNLESDGIIYPEAEVASGDVLIGKVSPPRFLGAFEEFRLEEIKRDTSICVRHGEKGKVELVATTVGGEGNLLIKVKVRDDRPAEIGDKFGNRHGQKGVIGIMLPEHRMPFTASGIIPDIIFNPDAIPSRMTIGYLLELLAGKVGSLAGEYIDATAFDGIEEEELRRALKELGFREDGCELLYNGETGEAIPALIFVGNIYYLKLRHLAANKLHARSRGPVQLLTRQPTEGRAKEGGLRLGEMEKECLVAHGASMLLKERFDSDKTIVPICKQCGLTAIWNPFLGKSLCPVCGEGAPIALVEMSYAFKLLLDELKALCIYPKLIIGPKE